MPEQTLVDDALTEPTAAPWITMARLLGVGIAFDLAVARQMPGIGIPIFFAVAIALLRGGFRRSWRDDVMLGGVLATSSFCALRSSPNLIAVDVIAALGMFAVACSAPVGSAFRATVLDGLRVIERLIRAAVVVPMFLLRPLVRAWDNADFGRAKPVLRAVAIAAPILIVFAALLASADRVFGKLLAPGLPHLDAASFTLHATLIVMGTGAAALVWCAGRTREEPNGVDDIEMTKPRLGVSEWAAVLGGIDVLFALFVGVQLAVLFGGKHRVQVTPGLTYAEYARSGFFQLIAVAGLTMVVLLAMWDLGTRTSRAAHRLFVWLVGAMIACTSVILISAWIRLGLYEQAFGFTIARLIASFSIVIIGVVLLSMMVAILLDARHRVVSVMLLCVAAALLSFNLIDPDRFVARHNIARARAGHELDLDYVGLYLGTDAVPLAVELLPSLSREERARLRIDLCVRARILGDREPSIRSYNAARAAARSALRKAGIDGRTCEA